MLDNVFREQVKAGELDGPALVRKLLVRIARRIEDRQEENDNGEIETRLSESDVRRLTDAEMESFSRKICIHNSWLFEKHEKSDADVSVKPKKVPLSKNNAERDSDRLIRALRVYMAEPSS